MRIRTMCNRDCPDACGMVATVEEGRVVRLQGDPDHPVTRGFLCFRTNRFLDRQYDPERLTRPLMRRGARFEPVSWDEALELVATTMRTLREESGGAAIMHYRCGGSLGMMKQISDAFFEGFGPVTIKSGDICNGPGEAAQLEDFGVCDSNDLFDLVNSRTIVLWGKNPHATGVHLLPVLRDAKARGARLVMIDPVRHKGADLCDLVLQPRPGGDLALALGVARWLFDHDRVDTGAAGYCDHLDAYRALCASRDLAGWASLADVTEQALGELARAYADGPSAILVGWGMQRRSQGAAIIRSLDALGAVSGNLGVPGGGVSFYFGRQTAFDTSFLRGAGVAPRAIPETLLGRGILEADDPPVRMVWVTAANPVAMLPDSLAVKRALESRELTVVVDSFLTDTARAAHLVLPTTTMLEDDDLLGAYGHHWIGELRPVVPPPGEVKSDYAIVQALAERLGMNGVFRRTAEQWKRALLAPVAGKGASLEALREGPVRSPVAPRQVLFEDRRFPTPSGRVNLIHDIDPDAPRGTASRPLLLMALASRRSQAGQWPASEQQGPAVATVHPSSAAGLADGDLALVESETGSLTVRLALDDRQRPDLLLMDKGGWLHAERCPNALIPAKLTDAGGGACYYETPVRLLPAGDGA